MAREKIPTEDALQAGFTAWTCVLAPDAIDDYEPLMTAIAEAAERSPDPSQFASKLGALRYRAGRHDEALEVLGEFDHGSEIDARSPTSPAYAWYFLAMTHQALGNSQRAQEVLAMADDWTDRALSDQEAPPVWNRRLTLQLLQREADDVIRAGTHADSPDEGNGTAPPRPQNTTEARP